MRASETPPGGSWKAETAAGLLQDRLCLVGGAGREESAGRWAAARGKGGPGVAVSGGCRRGKCALGQLAAQRQHYAR